MKVYILIGTRPNFIKITRFKAVGKIRGVEIKIIHTGQHFDANMSDVFFSQFGLEIDYFLNIGGQSPNSQTANILLKLEELFKEIGNPDLFIVPGDVNSTLAGAIAANKLGIKLAHLESGLRSFDREMPEEYNRILTDNLSDICFVTEPSGLLNLKNEGINTNIVFCGNTMIDTLVAFKSEIKKSTILIDLNLNKDKFILMTIHRPSNVDTIEGLKKLFSLIESLIDRYKIVFPIHPRTLKQIEIFGLKDKFDKIENLVLTGPLGYFEFQNLVQNSKFVLTDSGGIQEETTYCQIPCLTLRNNTERPITVTDGTNTLVPFDIDKINNYVKSIENGTHKKGNIPTLWDGKATERIFDAIEKLVK